MKKYALLVLLSLCFGDLVISGKLPSTYKRCKIDENVNTCLKEAIQAGIPHLIEGIPELDFPSIDPFMLSSPLTFITGQDDKQLHHNYTNVAYLGLGNTKIRGVETAFDDSGMLLSLNIDIPRLLFLSNCNLEGTIASIPLNVQGKCSWTFENILAFMTFIGKRKEGYIIIEDVDIRYLAAPFSLKLDSFSSNKELDKEKNDLFDKYWQEVQAEMQYPYTAAINRLYTILSNRIFKNVPFSEIFIIP